MPTRADPASTWGPEAWMHLTRTYRAQMHMPAEWTCSYVSTPLEFPDTQAHICGSALYVPLDFGKRAREHGPSKLKVSLVRDSLARCHFWRISILMISENPLKSQ